MNQLDRLELFNQYPEKTCLILHNNEIVFTSEAKGVKPIKDFYESNEGTYDSVIIVDRIVGKGAAMLAELVNAEMIITPIISEAALEYTKGHGIGVACEKVVPYIINRTKDGRCPIESAVLEINEANKGYEVINRTLRSLSNNNRQVEID